MATAAARPVASTSSWFERLTGHPGGQVGDQGQPEHLGARLAGGDGLQHRRHADQIGAQRPQHPDLRRRLEMRPGQLGVDALGQARVDLQGQRAQPRRVQVGQVDEVRAD